MAYVVVPMVSDDASTTVTGGTGHLLAGSKVPVTETDCPHGKDQSVFHIVPLRPSVSRSKLWNGRPLGRFLAIQIPRVLRHWICFPLAETKWLSNARSKTGPRRPSTERRT